MTLDHLPTSLVSIIGGDAIVGQTLKLLLRSAEFSARFLVEPSIDEPGWLDGVKLLLLASGLGPEHREAILRLIDSKPLATKIPVLALVDSVRAA